MRQGGDGMASIDLAVAFLSATVVLFVFVQFHLSSTRQEPPPASVGQVEETVPVTPPAWQAVNERGHFAVLDGTALTLLDMQGVGRGIVDPLRSYFGERGGLSWSSGGTAAPNAFRVNLRLVPADPPGPWRGARLDLAAEPSCPAGDGDLLTVFLPRDVADLGPLLALAGRCGLRLRYEFHDGGGEPGGTVTLPIGLGPAAYSRERMFR